MKQVHIGYDLGSLESNTAYPRIVPENELETLVLREILKSRISGKTEESFGTKTEDRSKMYEYSDEFEYLGNGVFKLRVYRPNPEDANPNGDALVTDVRVMLCAVVALGNDSDLNLTQEVIDFRHYITTDLGHETNGCLRFGPSGDLNRYATWRKSW